jgi:hypothetical protein
MDAKQLAELNQLHSTSGILEISEYELKELVKEVEILRAALEVYANHNNWNVDRDFAQYNNQYSHINCVYKDFTIDGWTDAEQALKGGE